MDFIRDCLDEALCEERTAKDLSKGRYVPSKAHGILVLHYCG